MNNSQVIAVVRKNNSQEVRVSVARHAGYALVDMRVFEAPRRGSGEPLATKAGICVVRDQLPALIEALQAAEREASQ